MVYRATRDGGLEPVPESAGARPVDALKWVGDNGIEGQRYKVLRQLGDDVIVELRRRIVRGAA